MSDSTRRTLRTAYQVLIAILTFVPVVLGLLPPDMATSSVIIVFGAWVAFVTRVHTALEDAGLIPDWLNVRR